MNKLLWILLSKVFCRGVDDDEAAEDEPADEIEPEDEPVEDDEEVEEDEPEDEPAPKTESRAQKEIRTLRDRAQKAEDDAKKARDEIAASRTQQPQSVQQSEAQKLWEEEEKVLKDPNIDSWQRYSIQSNRNARAAEFNSQQALQEARDLKDQAQFERVAIANPKAAERYKEEVERMKKANPNAPRSELMAYLLGKDILAGKLKAETKSTKSSGGANRGKLPGAKSDSRSSGSAKGDSLEALEKRLNGIRI